MQNLHPAFEGLTTAEVLAQRRRYGENALPSAKKSSAWGVFFNQFKNPLVYIILAAAGISLAFWVGAACYLVATGFLLASRVPARSAR